MLPIYRYFATEQNRDNFLEGDVWFASAIQNRGFVSNSDGGKGFPPDRKEYYYEHISESNHMVAIFLGAFALSFTLKHPDDKNKFWIKVNDADAFSVALSEYILDAEKKNPLQLKLFSEDELRSLLDNYEKYLPRYRILAAPILTIKKYLKNPDIINTMSDSLKVINVYGYPIEYIDKKRFYDIPEMPRAAYQKSDEYIEENEFRIVINTTLPCCNGISIHHLIKYISVKIPYTVMQDYCHEVYFS